MRVNHTYGRGGAPAYLAANDVKGVEMGNARPGKAGRFGVDQRRPTTLTQSLPSAGESEREPSKTARHVPDVRAGTRVEK